MEYKELAKYYDLFYQNKNYQREIEFLKNIIGKRKKILDVGCGTGRHMSLLEKEGYDVDGIDLNREMLEEAKRRVKGRLSEMNILDFKSDIKYDAIISMFAVMNHLLSTEQLKDALLNLKNAIIEDGIILLDLHNPQKSGIKSETYNNIDRTMEWDVNFDTSIEVSTITFTIDKIDYQSSHKFKIFKIIEVEKICEQLGLKVVSCYENYTLHNANQTSKNLQFIIKNL